MVFSIKQESQKIERLCFENCHKPILTGIFSIITSNRITFLTKLTIP